MVKVFITILEVAVVVIPLFIGVVLTFRTSATYSEKYNISKMKFIGMSKVQYRILFRLFGIFCLFIAGFAFWNNYIKEDTPVSEETRKFWDEVEKDTNKLPMSAVAFLTAIAIPARMGSSRFPGKPLARLGGKAVIERVYESCKLTKRADKIVILTDSPEISDFAKTISAECIMTSPECRSGTERIIEASEKIGADFVVNVQGDEPFISPKLIDSIIELGVDSKAQLVTAVSKINDTETLHNPNVVKALRDNSGNAIYFSRTALPYNRGVAQEEWLSKCDYWRHIGIYGYSAQSLAKYGSLPVSKMETCEMLEQLRFISAGYTFGVVETKYESIGIDTPEDLVVAEKYLKKIS